MVVADKNLNEAQPRLLAVAARPDDVEFTSGGTWCIEGWAIHLVVCTNGSKGNQNPEDDPKILSNFQHAEQEEAAQVLGIPQEVWLGYPDGELAR